MVARTRLHVTLYCIACIINNIEVFRRDIRWFLHLHFYISVTMQIQDGCFGFRDAHGDRHVFTNKHSFCTALANDMYKSEFL